MEPLGSVAPGGSSSGVIELGGDRDVFAVSLVAGRTYEFRAVPPAGSSLGDTAIVVLSGTGTTLGSSSAFSGNAAVVTATAATTGTYYVSVAGAYSTGTGAYTVSVSNGYVDDRRDVYNDPAEPLGAVAPGGTATGTIEVGGDRDIFAVSLVAGQTYTFGASGLAGGTLTGTSLSLQGATGGGWRATPERRRNSLSPPSPPARITCRHRERMPPWSALQHLVSAGAVVDDYRDTYNSSARPLGVLAAPGTATGKIEAATDKDIFGVSLVAGQTYTFTLAGSTWSGAALANPELRLLNASGVQLLTNNDFNGVSSRIVYTATASGTYYLDAHSFRRGRHGRICGPDADGIRRLPGQPDRHHVGSRVHPRELVAPRLYRDRGGHRHLLDRAGGGPDLHVRPHRLDLERTALANPELRLLNASGALLVTNNDFNGVASRIVYTATASGTYYLDAHSFTSAGLGGYH